MRLPRCAYCGERLSTPADKCASRVVHKFRDLPGIRGVTEVGWHGVCFGLEPLEIRDLFRDRFAANYEDRFGAVVQMIARRGFGRVVNSRGWTP